MGILASCCSLVGTVTPEHLEVSFISEECHPFPSARPVSLQGHGFLVGHKNSELIQETEGFARDKWYSGAFLQK